MQTAYQTIGWYNLLELVKQGHGPFAIRKTEIPERFSVEAFCSDYIRSATPQGLLEKVTEWAAEEFGGKVTFAISGPYEREEITNYGGEYLLEVDSELEID